MNTYFESEKSQFKESEDTIIDLKNLSEDEISNIQERLYKMIDYSSSLHERYDRQRNGLLQIGLTLIAASSGIGTIVHNISIDSSVLTNSFLWVFISVLFLTGLIILINFARKIELNHPYRKVADIRSWYFKYNFPKVFSDRLKGDISDQKTQVKEVNDAYGDFLSRWMEYANEKDRFVKEDLQQVFILQLLQRFKFQQVKSMKLILVYGLIVGSIFLALTLIAYFFS
ncbi:hypothetical protein LCM02_11640 [Lutimonas saemankumensis]|uniref:hypothetical protein n=1 Tax=Lutimonas saemankumensis TaxID=483016 RepID=UPI001CD41803|nr:hypothetical protein [Lutimonas saemankumensis]MCA0933108.1 hypothetical protein [Lutimonas saemankumensis]